MRKDIKKMVAGLPGTGIGGIYYLLIAVFMPIREFSRMIQKRTSLNRWCFISLQLGFVFGIISLMWVEVWGLNQIVIWFGHIFRTNHIAVMGIFGEKLTLHQAKIMAYASASGGFISLGFVFICVHTLRLFVHRNKKTSLSPAIYKLNKKSYCGGKLINAELLKTAAKNVA